MTKVTASSLVVHCARERSSFRPFKENVVEDGQFFVYDSSVRLSYHTFTKNIKMTTTRLGFNHEFFSTHSLRIGGASALAAAGVPDYIIQTMGRWKSLAFLMYIRLAGVVGIQCRAGKKQCVTRVLCLCRTYAVLQRRCRGLSTRRRGWPAPPGQRPAITAHPVGWGLRLGHTYRTYPGSRRVVLL